MMLNYASAGFYFLLALTTVLSPLQALSQELSTSAKDLRWNGEIFGGVSAETINQKGEVFLRGYFTRNGNTLAFYTSAIGFQDVAVTPSGNFRALFSSVNLTTQALGVPAYVQASVAGVGEDRLTDDAIFWLEGGAEIPLNQQLYLKVNPKYQSESGPPDTALFSASNLGLGLRRGDIETNLGVVLGGLGDGGTPSPFGEVRFTPGQYVINAYALAPHTDVNNREVDVTWEIGLARENIFSVNGLDFKLTARENGGSSQLPFDEDGVSFGASVSYEVKLF